MGNIKEKDEEGYQSTLTVGQLKEMIKDSHDNTEIYIRVCSNPCGNIVEAGIADKSTYGFFGESIECIIIEPQYSGCAKTENT